MKKILYILAAAAAVLAAGEIYARCFLVDLPAIEAKRVEIREGVSKELLGLLPRTGWLNKVGRVGSGEVPGVEETVLESGQRASGPKKDKPEKRVLLVGCSWLYGMGLRDEETLAALLNRRFPDVQFDNYGVPGFGTYQCLMLTDYLFDLGKKYDLVLYCFMDEHIFRQEMYRLSGRGSGSLSEYFVVSPCAEMTDGGLKLHPSDSFDWPGQGISALVYFLHAQHIFYKVRKYRDYYMGVDLNGQRELVCSLSAALDGLCRKNNSRFAVVSFTRLEIEWPCRIYSLYFKDIREPEYTNLGKPNNHPNGAAQRIWLEKLVPYLQEELR